MQWTDCQGMNGAPEAMTDWSRHAAAAAVVEAPALHADCICIPLHPCVPLQVYGPTAVNVHHLLEALRQQGELYTIGAEVGTAVGRCSGFFLRLGCC